MTPTIYDYVAAANPSCVGPLVSKYGFQLDIEKASQLPEALKLLVGHEGKAAFYDILEHHPDKEVFIEFVHDKYPNNESQPKLTDYLNFSGTLTAATQVAENRKATNDLSLMVLAGAVIVAFAIITK